MTRNAPQGSQLTPPSALLAASELPRSFVEVAMLPLAAPFLLAAPRGDGHPVLVLPGFTSDDASTAVLRNYLLWLGYSSHGWKLGRNLGPRSIGAEGERLAARLKTVHEATGRKVSVVGWSLGGAMARLVARRTPEAVRQVITLGSPVAGHAGASNVSRLYQLLCGEAVDGDGTRRLLDEVMAEPAVPSTAIYSVGDGVVAWRNCMNDAGARSESIRVRGSHSGLGFNASVLYAVADRLALPEGEWWPFDRDGFASCLYPVADDA